MSESSLFFLLLLLLDSPRPRPFPLSFSVGFDDYGDDSEGKGVACMEEREREREREREPLLSAADSPAPPRRPVPACPFRPPSPNPHSRVATRSLPTSPTTRPGERAKEWGGGAARPFMSSRRINAQLGYWHAFYAASGSIV